VSAVWGSLFWRRWRRAPDHMRDRVWTPATQLTLTRAILSAVLLLFAIVEESQPLLLLGLALSMVLDILDGYIARALQDETVFGAQLDGLADRLTAALVLAGMVFMNPTTEVAAAAAVVWAQYGIVEQFLNAQFLRFGLWSPDHFHVASELVWKLNWSALAKMASGLPVVLMGCGFCVPAAGAALALIVLRLPCFAWIATAAKQIPERDPREITAPEPLSGSARTPLPARPIREPREQSTAVPHAAASTG
jgi:phosphatidylglycerophosphate synthase